MPISKKFLRDLYNHLAQVMDAMARQLGSAASELYDEIIEDLPEPEREGAGQDYGPGVDREQRIEKLKRKVEDMDEAIDSGFASDELKELRDRLEALADMLEAQKALEKNAETFRAIAESHGSK